MNATPDPLFDRLVRLRLESAQCLPDPSDWDRLAQALDMAAATHTAFDTLVANRLLQPETETEETPDFQAFEAKLGDPFDQLLAARLLATETNTFMPCDADWDSLEALLPHTFDQQVQQKLSDYSLPEQPADWALVARQLPAGFDATIHAKLHAATAAGNPAWGELQATRMTAVVAERLRDYTAGGAADWPMFQRKLMAAEGSRRVQFAWVVARITSVAAAIALLVTAGIQVLGPAPEQGQGQMPLASQQPPRSGATPGAQQAERALPSNGRGGGTHPLPPQVAPGQPFQDTYAGIHPTYDFSALEDYDAEPLLKAGGMIARSSSVWRSGPKNRQSDMQHLQPLMGFAPAKTTVYQYPGAGQPAEVALPSHDFSPAIWLGATSTGLISVVELSSRGLTGQINGLRMMLQFGSHWGVVTGIQAGSKQFEQVYLDLSADRSTWISSRTIGKVTMIEYPLLVRYTGGRYPGKPYLYFQGGLSPSMTLRECFTVTREGVPANESSSNQAETGLRTYAGTLHLAPGMAFPLGRAQQAQLQVEPYLQLGLQPLSDTRSKLSSAGLTVSLLYRVKE